MNAKLCECGCGNPSPIAKRTNSTFGHKKGFPIRFISGHVNKGKNGTDIERFFNKIKIDEKGCWIWTDYILNTGYGQFKVNGKQITAHKFIYEHIHGKVQKGLTLDHLCRNRSCANPGHLEVTTYRENLLRGIGLPAINYKKTHCNNGHPLSGENLYIYQGTRNCKICRRKRSLESHRRTKEKLNSNMVAT